MALGLTVLTPMSGGFFWQVTYTPDPPDPGVLRMEFPEEFGRNTDVPEISPPEAGRREWTLDFDALRERMSKWESGQREAARLPAWVKGRVSATPSEVGSRVRFDLTPEMFG